MAVDNWRSTSWIVDLVDMDRLTEAMKKIPDHSERVINQTLQTKVEKTADTEIITKMPLSEMKKRLKGHAHAKESRSLNTKHENLGFTIRPTKKFNYLKYPDLAIGTSWNNEPQEFMRKGMEQKVPAITEVLQQALDEEISKLLGGK
ncbi:hypothetical protein I6N96_03200 [Enterococcus sp. BWM-S5]|uniref:HK97 gp10 family phage protein n=1 Tax=Enterococcus larvae TaxID=2794352 RepID=A0ABS4CF63_9ENTE|nr:hypothetical protein [Enterococcus larvae]MBP1045270.1 hypothetical protein [Enterococcus larvae]